MKRSSQGADLSALLVLVAAGLWARLPLLHASPYGDEAAHFAMARTLGFLDGTVHYLGLPPPLDTFRLYPLTLGRPAFTLLYAPAALFGFTAFRAFGIACSVALACLAYLLARRLGARWPAAFLCGLVLCLHPALAVWGARVFPDSAMAALVLGGLLALDFGRPRLASALLLAAALTKETAIPTIAGLLAFSMASTWRGRRESGMTGWRALAPSRTDRWLGAALLASPVGIAASYLAFPKLPGWTSGGTLGNATELLALSGWLLLPAAGAWAIQRARPTVAALGALLAFYWLFIVLRHGGVNGWYAALPAALVLCLAATCVDWMLRQDRARRALGAGVAVALFAIAAAGIVGGAAVPTAIHPLDPHGESGLVAAVGSAKGENAFLESAMAFHGSAPRRAVLEIDLQWYWIVYPFEGRESTLYLNTFLYNGSTMPIDRVAQWADQSDIVWLQEFNSTFDRAFRATYADCVAFHGGPLVAYEVPHCAGRAAQLTAAYRSALRDCPDKC